MTDPRSFGAWLRRERERRTITLRTIADRTKIGAGLLEALERGDVSRWPGGIYRRAFIRSYADAIGLDADLVVANFERVFPPDGVVATSTTSAPLAAAAEDGMRLALAAPASPGINRAALKKAGIDVGAILGFGIAGLIGAGAIGFWCAAAVVAIVLHVSRVVGLEPWAVQLPSFNYREAKPRAEVLSFAGEQVRLTRRARAQRVLATLSAAASSAGIPGRRRAARS